MTEALIFIGLVIAFLLFYMVWKLRGQDWREYFSTEDGKGIFEAAIAAIEDHVERRAMQIEYEAERWERSNPRLVSLWTQLGLDEGELDELFIEASKL